ncbi:hypothetical protein [Asinibacterium sp. OR53]|uniref:hypothetical protein n=1 Tax=Asinibacterium sp. OR53 TaxID=925409 RepID=UPI000479808D|nr:hypothetical protein [Asinibacterium sp. OR53]
MKQFFILLVFCIGAFVVHGQSRRIDTTLKIGKVGYRITCSNRNPEKNDATINPIGFENQAREFSIEIKGRIKKAEIDDLNNDGFPDVVLYVFSGDSLQKGTVIGISSDKNQSVNPIILPDVLDDQKLREGYRGFDDFNLMEGTLMRRYPLYLTDSLGAHPTGKMRQVLYRVVPGERNMLKFKVIRSYEYTKQ